MQRDSRIFVAGHRGLAGSAVARAEKSYPAEFIYQNLAIQTKVIDKAKRAGVRGASKASGVVDSSLELSTS
jgi:hypothetical protein